MQPKKKNFIPLRIVANAMSVLNSRLLNVLCQTEDELLKLKSNYAAKKVMIHEAEVWGLMNDAAHCRDGCKENVKVGFHSRVLSVPQRLWLYHLF